MTALIGSARGRALAAVATLVLIAVLGSAAQANAYPSSMDALGDSITRAFNTCKTVGTDCPENSWATGTNKAVDSYYERLLAKEPAISGKNFNDAVSGSKMSELNTQASSAVTRKVALVGIFMGNNDVCTSSVGTMTSVASFESQFKTAMATLHSGIPSAAIKVSSLANVYRLWEILHSKTEAATAWTLGKICQSMLANPTSMEPADVTRRKEVRIREEEFNLVLETVCATYTTQCVFDKDAGYNSTFGVADVSTVDYFHPSIEGQALIASVAWTAVGY